MWVFILFVVLSILSISYGLMIMSVASGSNFFLFWILLGALFLLCGVSVHRRMYQLLPRWILFVSGVAICACLLIAIFFMAKIFACFEWKSAPPCDCIIVLGAQMKEDGPSVVLKYRLDYAADYLKENPETVCIVTGARGTNEPMTEARGMADYLISSGINSERIILEEMARNTEENIRFSKKLLPSGNVSVGIVTNNFHMYRALGIARKQGIENAEGLAAKSTEIFLPNNVTREVIAVLKDLLCGNMAYW